MEMKFRTLRADEIDCRVGSCSKDANNPWCTMLLYKDARVDMRLLDEVVGATNWKRSHELVNGNLYCTVSVWDEDKKEWVSKQDVGTESNTEAVKGQTSDAFKRACFNWGIGRELYSAPFIYIKGGGKSTNAYVKEIGYDEEGNITSLVILGKRSGKGQTECLFDLKCPSNAAQMKACENSQGTVAQAQGTAAVAQGTAAQAVGGMVQTSGAPTENAPEWMKKAWDCKNIGELAKLAKELIAQNMWDSGVQNYFTNIKFARGWN